MSRLSAAYRIDKLEFVGMISTRENEIYTGKLRSENEEIVHFIGNTCIWNTKMPSAFSRIGRNTKNSSKQTIFMDYFLSWKPGK